MEDERPISFVGTTASDSETVETHEFESDGVILGVTVTTHPGQEGALRQTVEVVRNGSPVSLWNSLDEPFLSGDGEDYKLPLRFEFEEDDVLKFRAENINTDGFDYSHDVVVDVDYERSIVERLAGAIGRAV